MNYDFMKDSLSNPPSILEQSSLIVNKLISQRVLKGSLNVSHFVLSFLINMRLSYMIKRVSSLQNTYE